MEPVLLCYAGIDGRPVCELYSDEILDMVENAPQMLEERGITLEDIVGKRRDDVLNKSVLTEVPSFQPEEDEMALKNAAFQLALYLNVKYGNLREFFDYRLNFVDMTKAELSRKLSYTPPAISKWLERESLGAEGNCLEKLAELLDVPVDFLMLYKKVKPVKELDFEEIKSLQTYGDKLCYIRRCKDLTQAEAGEIFDISGSTLSYYENNQFRGRKGLCVLDFAKDYDVPIDVLAPLDESELPKDIPECIKYRRRQLYMSQTRLANEAGIARQTVSRIEAGGLYKDSTLEKILRVLFEDYPEIAEKRFGVISEKS